VPFPRFRRSDPAPASSRPPYRVAWGLEPSQWRPLGGRIGEDRRATLLWVVADAVPDDVALRARRAYDAIAERGTPLVAQATPRGIEIDLPVDAVAPQLRRLAGYGILPDAVLVTARVGVGELRTLRTELKRLRPEVPVSVVDEADDAWIADLRRTSGLA
jgi:hypothetical protein